MINSLHEKKYFTVEIDAQEIPFLDILMKKIDGKITTDIYHKSIDTFNYLPFNSSHPGKTKTNIPYNLARRICMMVTDEEVKEIRLLELRSRLTSKEFSKKDYREGNW